MDIKIIEQVIKLVEENKNEVVEIRRWIHRNPELSFQEYKTSDFVYGFLNCIPGVELYKPTDTSVLAVLKGGKPGKVLAVRADMDALALNEENECEYKSRNKGIMHACGHDGHTAMLLGAAQVLAKLRQLLKGEIRFIFQHAEEKHPGGAKELVSKGVLDGVDMIIAGHLWVPLEVGKIGITTGPLMASPDNFSIAVYGKGGHAAIPHETIDPIVIAAHVITGLQSLVSRCFDPLEPLVISVTQINGGSAYNIIPGKVELKGTARSFNSELRKTLPPLMEKMIKGTVSAFGGEYQFNYEYGYDPVNNDKEIAFMIKSILTKVLGENIIHEMKPVMGSEDFSEYLKIIPGAFFFIGAGNKNKGISFPHHHPKFDIDEDALEIGTKALVLSSLALLD